MRYRDDYMNKMQTGLSPQPMPKAYDSFNVSMPYNGSVMGAQQQMHHNGSVFGAQQQMPSTPVGYPTCGAIQPQLPTGLPSTAAMPAIPAVPGIQVAEQIPPTVSSVLFTPGFLRTQIGRRMKVEFLIGTSGTTDRTGTLVAVGASYILIRLFESDDIMMCDIYSIKFVTIYL